MSDRAEVHQNNCWTFEGQDAMWAITFATPGTCPDVRWPAWMQYSMKPRPCRRRPAVEDLDFEVILSTQLTVGVLLHSMPSNVCLELTCTNATLTARTSAASSKSEFVSRSLGVSTEITSFAMSSGNFPLQTTGGELSQRENQTPLLPLSLYCGSLHDGAC